MLIFRRFERKQIISSNEFQIRIFPIHSYFIWNCTDRYVHTLPYFSRKTYPIPDQNGQKPLLFRAAHTYIAFLRERPPPPARKAIWHSVNIALEERLQ